MQPPYLREAYLQAQAKVIERDVEIAQLRLAVRLTRKWVGPAAGDEMVSDLAFADRIMARRA